MQPPVSNYTDVATPQLEHFRQSIQRNNDETWEMYKNVASAEVATEEDYGRYLQTLIRQSRRINDDKIVQIFTDMQAQGYLSLPKDIGAFMLHELTQIRYDNVRKLYSEWKATRTPDSSNESRLVMYSMLTAYAAQDVPDVDIEELLAEFPPEYLHGSRYNRIMRSHLPQSLLQKTENLIVNLEDREIKPNTELFTARVTRAFNERNFDKAMELYQKAAGCEIQLNDFTYGAFITGFISVQRMRDAISVWNDMIQSGMKPNVITYHAMLDGFGQRRDLESAEKIWARMHSSGIAFDVVSYTTMMNVCFSARKVDRAMELFLQMQNAGIEANLVVCNTILNGLLENGQQEMASKFHEYMQNEGIVDDLITYNTFLRSYVREGDLDSALETVQAMSKAGINPDVWTFTTLLASLRGRRPSRQIISQEEKAAASEARLKIISALIQDMHFMGIEPNTATFTSIIDGLAKENNMEAAHVVFETMQKMGIRPNVKTYTTMMQGYLRGAGEMESALKMLNQMMRQGIKPDAATYHALIAGYFDRNDVDSAMQMYEQMKQSGLRAGTKTYTITLDSLARLGHRNLAQGVIKDMGRAGFKVESRALARLVKAIERK